MRRCIILFKRCLCMVLTIFIAATTGQSQTADIIPVDEMLININNLSMYIRADGRLSPKADIKSMDSRFNWALFYPHQTTGLVYTDGVVWGGMVHDGREPMLRVGGTKYKTGLQPGQINSNGVAENVSDLDQQIWRIRSDWQTADLRREALETFSEDIDVLLNTQQIDTTDQISTSPLKSPSAYQDILEIIPQEYVTSVKDQYHYDWTYWPWQKGAPFYDDNKNGMMDEGEEPGFAHADQVVWFVANDLNPELTNNLFSYQRGSPPIGMEMQVTYWAYNKPGSRMNDAFSNMIFKRVRLIYKGTSETPDTARIDSMTVSQFASTDIGDATENFAGCDTLLQLGYAYNSTTHDYAYDQYGIVAPAIGYTLLQGPKTNSIDAQGNQSFLPMTSFWMKSTGTTLRPETVDKMYKCMNGFLPTWGDKLYPFLDCGDPEVLGDGQPTKFMLSGDPVADTGCIDGMHHVHPGTASVRSIMLNSGPFSMALGDTQDIYIAIVAGLGSDRNGSISVMKHNVKWARQWAAEIFKSGLTDIPKDDAEGSQSLPQDFRLYENYPNPFNAETTICYDLPIQRNVILTIFNAIGQEVDVLVDENQLPGQYSYRWNGQNTRGANVPSGIYYIRLKAGDWIVTRKMILLK